MKYLHLALCLIFLVGQSTAQIKKKYVEEATALRETYKEEKVVLNYSLEEYNFKKEKDKDGNEVVKCEYSGEEEYMGLVEGAELFVSEGYNDMMDITNMTAKFSLGGPFLKAPLNLNDRDYSSESIFDSDSRLKYFIVPIGTTGLRYQINVEKEYQDVRYLTGAYFFSGYPTLQKRIVYKIPKWLNVELREFNFDGYEVKKTVDEDRSNTTYTYEITNTAGLEGEKFTPNPNRVYPHVMFVAKSFEGKNGNTKIFEKVDDLYAWYNSLTKELKNDKTVLKPLVEKIITGKTDDIAKVKAIYYWVQDNIKYIAFERGIAGFKPEEADAVYKNKYGDCKGMANLLTNMLQIAGYDARLTWIGTNDIPYDYSLPSMVVDNHMICALKLNDKRYFLDGTESYISFDDYALRIQGREALISDGDKFVIERVPDLPRERNKYEETKELRLEKDVLVGKVTEGYYGERQTNFLRVVNDFSAEDKIKNLTKFVSGNDKDFEVTNLSNTEFNDREKPVSISYDVKIKNKVTDLNPEMYIAMDYSGDLEGLLPDEKRKTAIEFDTKGVKVYKTELTIPVGYTVKYLPNDLNINTGNYSFTVNYKQAGNKIVLTKSIALNNFLVPMSKMKDFRADLKKLKDSNNDQIILTK
jgi:transglutaminase-like putative cysteine protease